MSANHPHAPSPKPIRGHIPIRPDLLQFVVWRENLPQKTDPLRLPGHGAICNYLTDLIQFGRTIHLPLLNIEREPLLLEGLTERLRFECAAGFLDESFFQYADLVAHYFNDFLRHQWKEEVDRWCAAIHYCDPKRDRKQAIADLHLLAGMDGFREVESDIRADHRFRDYRGLVEKKVRR